MMPRTAATETAVAEEVAAASTNVAAEEVVAARTKVAAAMAARTRVAPARMKVAKAVGTATEPVGGRTVLGRRGRGGWNDWWREQPKEKPEKQWQDGQLRQSRDEVNLQNNWLRCLACGKNFKDTVQL